MTTTGALRVLPKFISPILLLVLWEVSVRAGWLDSRLVAPPSLVIVELWRLVLDGQLIAALSISLMRAVAGFCLAAVFGVILGMLMARIKAFEVFFDPLVELLRPVSPLALFPLFILWFGIGEASKVLIIAFACCFPVILNTFAGVRSIDRSYFRASRTLGASPFEVMRTVILPGSFPQIFTGLRLAWGIALIVIVAAEMIGAVRGIGYMVLDSQQTFRIPRLFGSIVVIGILGYVTDLGLRFLMLRMLPWHQRSEE